MDRRKRHLAVICAAVATAALASFGMYLTIKRIPVREVEVARHFVVVAARPLPTGVRVTADDVKRVAWPASAMVSASFSTVDAVVNRALLAPVVENEPLTESKLARLEAGAGLPPIIRPGMRAMSVKVNDVIGVAGFIDSGTRVDLVVTIRKKDDTISRTVVSNVEVLTAGTRFDQQQQQRPKAKDSKPTSPSPVVTLLVTPEDAERIALAQAEGQIMLVLRNPLDTTPTATTGVRTAALLGPGGEPVHEVVKTPRVRPAPPVVQVVEPPARRTYTYEAIRAAKRSEEVVR
jgi:pilus assembly protein CpaB